MSFSEISCECLQPRFTERQINVPSRETEILLIPEIQSRRGFTGAVNDIACTGAVDYIYTGARVHNNANVERVELPDTIQQMRMYNLYHRLYTPSNMSQGISTATPTSGLSSPDYARYASNYLGTIDRISSSNSSNGFYSPTRQAQTSNHDSDDVDDDAVDMGFTLFD